MKILLFANTDWYLYNFRRALSLALQADGHELILISPPGEYGPKLRELGLDWRPLPMQRRSLNPWAELVLVRHLYRLLRDEDVDIVHGFTLKPAVYCGVAGALAGVGGRIGAVAGLGYVFTSDQWRARLLRPVVRLGLRLAFAGRNGRLIVQNPDDEQLLLQNRLVEPRHLRLIMGSGVDCDVFQPAAAQSRESQTIKVLFAARLLWDKGIAEFIAAAQQILQESLPCEFLIAGEPDEGNPSAVPATTVAEWSQLEGITCLGHVDEMADLYRAVDIAVLPSYREGLPKGLLEAAASGLPIVTTDVPGCREVVDDGVSGFLVPARDVQALAAAISRLVDDGALRDSFGRSAREKISGKFSQDIVIRQTLEVYAEFVR